MHILSTNHDDCGAPGMKVLTQAPSALAEVPGVAPDRGRIGASRSLTSLRPLRVIKRLQHDPLPNEAGDSSDADEFHALEQGITSVTPVRTGDPTRHRGIQALQNWLHEI